MLTLSFVLADAGTFKDLDRVAMLSFLQSREGVQTKGHLFNRLMFEGRGNSGSGGTRLLDEGWRHARGLRGLRYEALSRKERHLSMDVALVRVVVRLG